MKKKLALHCKSARWVVLACLAMILLHGLEVHGAENPPNPVSPAAVTVQQPAGQPAAPASAQAAAEGQAAPPAVNGQVEPEQKETAGVSTPPIAAAGQVPGQAVTAVPAPGLEEAEPPGNANNPLRAVPPRSTGVSAPASAPGAAGGRVSLNFDDADVFSVIQTVFGDIMRVNYVIDPKVKGRVTFRSVAPIATDEVLSVMEVILRINGIGVVEDGGLYRIVPIAEVSREPSPVSFGKDPEKIPAIGKSIIQVVPITYLQSTEVVKLITPFLSTNAVCLDVPKSNQIIIVDTDASVRRILHLIGTFDNETQKKKRASVFVYPVQNQKARDIAMLLRQIFFGIQPTVAQMGSPVSTTAQMPGVMTPTQPGQIPASPMAGSPMTGLPMAGSPSQALRGNEALVSEITKIYADEIINSIIVLSTPEDYETIKETIAKLDVLPRQVMIEGLIAQVTLTDNMSLGLAYSMRATTHIGGSSLTGDLGVNADTLAQFNGTTTSTSGTTTALPASTGFSYIAKDTQGIFRLYVNALANNSNGKLLAAPHILVSDNREARIQVGQQVPIVTSSTILPAGTTTGTIATQTIQYKDIGIILKIKPQVNQSGLVTLEMSQEVSTFDTIQLGQGQTDIILNKTEASTHLVVQDGHTVVIGGLIREDKSTSKIGVPFLNRIPILGYLFGNASNQSTRQELVILLTPHVIRDQREAQAATSAYIDNITSGKSSKGGLTKDEILKSGVQSRDNFDTGWSVEGQAPPGH